ncbi:MAG: ABC transporter permease, partial [Theionarchaea archaeon]|nr:ABC transporter permease [Theionarchaea archaeon]
MSMFKFILKRAGEILITLFIITTLIFILFRLMPGDPASMVVSPRMTPELKAILRARFGLDKPLWYQYYLYLSNIVRG